jgi:hypothetical protein
VQEDRDLLFGILERLRLEPGERRTEIESCTSKEQLQEWIYSTLTATTIEDIFGH